MNEPSQPRKLAFKIHGMDCAEEVAILKRELRRLVPNEAQLRFDVLNGQMVVEDAESLTADQVVQAVRGTGMRAEPWQPTAPVDRSGFRIHWSRVILTALSISSGALGFVTHAWIRGSLWSALGNEGTALTRDTPFVAIAFYLGGILCGTWFVLPKAWHSAIRFRPDMNLLMVVAIVGAATIGDWFEAATVAFLFSASLLLESWSVYRSRKAIGALLELTPTLARIRDDQGGVRSVLPEDVPIGEVFFVRPGEKIALDGVIVKGTSEINQAPITGESIPVEKSTGDEVFAGTINGNGAIDIRSNRLAENSTLARIVRMVNEAQTRRAPAEQWVERFARWYTPTIMILAAMFLTAPPIVFQQDWLEWFYRSLVLLVIACPCALVISTPVAVVAALASAARNGVLIKGGLFVEKPSSLAVMALDKTGTLTRGQLAVVEIFPMNQHTESELLERAAALESHSNHPLARAILEKAKEIGVSIPPADEVTSIAGKGSQGVIFGRPFWLGSHRLLHERGQETAEVHDKLNALQAAGHSIVVIGNDDHVCGFIALADTVRPGTPDVIAAMREAGIQEVVLLTGDNQGTADAIGRQTGVDRVYAELLPQDKVDVVESLVRTHGQVAMVGDGVNDAPALARSSVGIAMGAAGSDAAIETADIALMSDDLTKLPWLIWHSRRTLAIIRQNISFSLGIKFVFVVLTFVGTASLWMAIAADMGASLLVIFNSLRLLKIQIRTPRRDR